MINLIDLIYIERNLISSKDCDIIIEENKNEVWNKENSLNIDLKHTWSKPKFVSVNPYKESIKILNEKTHDIIKLYFLYLKEFKYFLPEPLISSFKYSHNYRFITYEESVNFHTHIDWNKDNSFTGSCTINLSEDYQGGQLTFFNENYDVELKKGDVVIFPASAFFTHGVKPIKSGIRYCVNSFLGPEMISNSNKFYIRDNSVKNEYEHFVDFKRQIEI